MLKNDDLDTSYTAVGQLTEQLHAMSKPYVAGDDVQLGQLINLACQTNSILMGICAELVYARHTTPIVAAVPAKLKKTPKKQQITLSEIQSKKRR